MPTTLTRKGQVTVPKRIRDALHLAPGSAVDFTVNRNGEVVLQKAGPKTPRRTREDRFDAVRGTADVKWRTAQLMSLLRGND